MRCRTAQRRIELQLDHELRGKSVRPLDLHLAKCAQCRSYQAQARQLKEILTRQPAKEFPSWLHHQILSQAAQHDKQRRMYRTSWNLRTIPAFLAVVFSLSMGVLVGKEAYRTVKTIPENAVPASAAEDSNMVMTSFGQSSLVEDAMSGGETQ